MDIDPGTVVASRYRISRPLGRGGMGEVFAAENIRTGRPVAVKLLRSDSKAKSSAVARFRREARAAGSINSDHVTQVLDVDEDAEHGIVLVFELLEGESLIERLKRTGPISFEELHPIVDQVWMGLADAHRAGIIHRDLKPSNVFLERRPDGMIRVKILDFGISKLPKEMGGETLTEMGQSLGTFSFMPPEQIGKAKTVDHRADIYACSTMIYQALTGQLPYTARNILVMVEMKTKTEARKLADAMGVGVDARLEAFLAKGLARDPTQRFQSAFEALNAWRDLRPSTGSGQNLGAANSSGVASSHPGATSTPAPGAAGTGGNASQGGPHRSPSSAGIALVVARPAGPVAIEQKPPEMLSEPTTTDSSAATLAMPIVNLGQTDPIPARPQVGLGGTLLVKPGDGPAHRPNPNARQGDQGMPGMQRHPSGYYLPATQQGQAMQQQQHLQQQQQNQQNQQQQNQQRQTGQVPQMIDESTSAPGSTEQTRIYRPDRPGPMIESNSSMSNATNGTQDKRSSMIPLVLGAIAFGLVGFAIVVALLQYLHTH